MKELEFSSAARFKIAENVPIEFGYWFDYELEKAIEFYQKGSDKKNSWLEMANDQINQVFGILDMARHLEVISGDEWHNINDGLKGLKWDIKDGYFDYIYNLVKN